MATTFFPQPKTSITLQSFINYVESNEILKQLKNSEYDAETMQAMVNKFAQLGANKTLLSDHLAKDIANFCSFQMSNDFKPSTILIHQGNGYAIRAVIWMPENQLYPPEVFSYYETHDHNFDFLTVGYFGSGYTTRIYNYDYHTVKGIVNEAVALNFLEETKLPEGKVMYYYGSQDVHTQLPPDELSVSLNLIIPKNQHKRQYEFALPPHTSGSCRARLIQGRIDRTAQERCLMEAAAAMGDENNLSMIRDIAKGNPSPEVRAIALKNRPRYYFPLDVHPTSHSR